MRPIRLGGWLVLTGALMVCGCTMRATLHTEVDADGSWTRTERFQGCCEEDLRGMFALPEGAPWTGATAEKGEETSYTARRRLRPGETLMQDLLVRREENGAVQRLLVSEVTVREAGHGRWEYREALRWLGPRPKRFVDAEPELRRILQESLPEGAASEKEIRDLAWRSLCEGWRVLTGPGEAWLSGIGHPELWIRRARERLGVALETILRQKLDERLTSEQRRATVQKLIAKIPRVGLPLAGFEQALPDEDWFDDSDHELVPLMISVKLPGRLVATNGEFNAPTGEVVWGFFAGAPALEELVLTATSEQASATDGATGSNGDRLARCVSERSVSTVAQRVR